MADEGGVAAVDRALSILDALTDDKVTLAELSKRTDLYKSTVLRLLKSLEKFGYVLRSADGSYRLGSKVLHLGSLYQRHFRPPTSFRRCSSGSPPSCTKARRSTSARKTSGSACIASRRRARCATRSRSATACRSPSAPPATCCAPSTARAASASTRSASACTPLVRRARLGDRGHRRPRPRPGQQARRRAQRLGSALPHRGGGEAQIVPVLFKYAKELTRTFGGVVDDPTLMGWNLRAPPGRRPKADRDGEAERPQSRGRRRRR